MNYIIYGKNMLSYFFIFIVGLIILAILKSMLRKISYENEFNPDYSSTVDEGRILNFDTNTSELQQKPVSS